jgi:hypothetical protein
LDVAFGVPSHAVEEILAARRQAHSQVKSLLEKSSAAMKRSADVHRRPADWSVGDSVLLSTSHLPLRAGTRKLAEKFTGPFEVLE